jgi:hypothetical protein
MRGAVCLANINMGSTRLAIGGALTRAEISARMKASQADHRVIVIGSETRSFLEATLVLLTTLKSGTVRAVANNPVIADVEVPIQA